jgi:hypothetical protein
MKSCHDVRRRGIYMQGQVGHRAVKGGLGCHEPSLHLRRPGQLLGSWPIAPEGICERLQRDNNTRKEPPVKVHQVQENLELPDGSGGGVFSTASL